IWFFVALLIWGMPSFGQDAAQMPNRCTNRSAIQTLDGPIWSGWGADASNTRFQGDHISTAQLKLKWAFGFPGAKAVSGQPSIAGGRVFVSSDNGYVYSLDAATGCVYWSFHADATVRSSAMIEKISAARYAAYFGDAKANAYAVDASTGELIWKVHVEEHPSARITGGLKVFENRVYVPVASGEEGAGGNANYPCCTFRGSVVALNAATGAQIWKTYMISDEPKPVKKNSNGVQRWAPAGAGVWNSPTIDAKRRALYVGTGDAYAEPAAKTTDSIVALNLDTGKVLWSVQDTENDVWLAVCGPNNHPENCPDDLGPDHDFGSPPILKTLPTGRSILIAGQKSGNVWAHDPDNKGAVLWKTPLVANTKEFGGKIVWGGAADDQYAYFGLGPGGIAAVRLTDGEKIWFRSLTPAANVSTHPGQDGPLTAVPGLVFSGGWDGVVRALSTVDGNVAWEFNTMRDFEAVNGVAAKGGSMGAAGPVVAGSMLLVPSGYVGVRSGIAGNVLLAFGAE
ncbi:MAG TPA: PQQ-binding-like beta-propeller repeat protein, partial [Terriglobia bacterium]|nr:PQQ-binding-like beta-propeller repeat protein [Terriglobia bacterium]